MSPKKIVFDEPIVRVPIDKVRFPVVCPICTAPAEEHMRISIIPEKRMTLTPSSEALYSQRYRFRTGYPPSQAKHFIVPVCEEHHYTDEGAPMYKSYCLVFDGIALAMVVFAVLLGGDRLWRGYLPDTWMFVVITIFFVFLGLTYVLFQPGPIESAVRIIGFDTGARNVWFEFRNPAYRDAFLRENEMNAELVRWIMKS